MAAREWQVEDFEEHRPHLRAVAYRMLGSASEADDAVQDAWMRFSRTDTGDVQNLGGWLTTVVARLCLNLLRSRTSRREEPLESAAPESSAATESGTDPEEEAVLADSVGVAMLVVLDTLAPAERLAFVLHDMFAVPFDEIGPMIERSPAAARQLGSRARRRVRGADMVTVADAVRQRQVVDAYLAAARDGDFEALVELLAPDVVLRADAEAVPTGKPGVLRGVRAVTSGALGSAGRAGLARPVMVNGAAGLVMARRGRLAIVLEFTVVDGRITEIDVVASPDRLQRLELAVRDA